MNHYFVRRVTSSIFASLFALSFGFGSVKSVGAEDTKRLDFCKQNKSLFHLDEGAERKVRIAVSEFQSSKFILKDVYGMPLQTSPIEITGLDSVLESKLVKDNELQVIKWSQIESTDNTSSQPPIKQLQKLRHIRDKNDVEAVIIVTVMQFDTEKTSEGGWLLTKDQKAEEVDIKLNLQVVDTTTGEIVLEAQGNGNENGNISTEVKLPFSVSITYGISSSKHDPNNSLSNNYRGYSINFQLGGKSNTTTISESSNTIKQKLVALATEKAMNEITDRLNSHSEELACLLRKPTLIADVNGNQVTLNKGKSYGYCQEMTFSIERSLQPIIDPATGRVISMKTEKVGTIKLFQVEAQSSIGKIDFTEPGQSFRVKDIAKITSNCLQNQEGSNSTQNPEPQNSSAAQENQASTSVNDL